MVCCWLMQFSGYVAAGASEVVFIGYFLRRYYTESLKTVMVFLLLCVFVPQSTSLSTVNKVRQRPSSLPAQRPLRAPC